MTTLAGQPGTSGTADGTGSTARFFAPSGIAMDARGDLWVADTFNHTIRRVTQAGVVTTVAGVPGSSGRSDGVGSQARFNEPWGLAFDRDGNLYIADVSNHLVRIMTPNGVVTAFAGSGSEGSSDSTSALSASFLYPIAVATDSDRNVYVADWGNSTIRKIGGGRVTTLAGNSRTTGTADGTGTAARFDNPSGITVDRNNVVYVADTGSHAIRRVTAAGVVTTVAGTPASPGNVDGTGSAARFFWPQGIAIDAAGGVIVLDTYNHVVKRATLAPPTITRFTVTPSVARSGETVTLSWQTSSATSVTIDNGIGSVNTSDSRAVVVTATTTWTLTATGPGGTTAAQVTAFVGSGKRRPVKH